VKERFNGSANRRLLIDALKTQKMVGGDQALAEELADLVEILEVTAGETIIHQGAADNDIFFILVGSVNVVVNGRPVAKRETNDHIGEMSAMQPTQRRTATIVAAEDSVLCKLSESQLAELGSRHGDVWRKLSKELVSRLAQRNELIRPAHNQTQVFIMSSVEALHIAQEIQNKFAHDAFDVTIWTDDVFAASGYTLESLEKVLDDSDFAIAIAQPDDLVTSRGTTEPVPRDNVIFEFGLFVGRIGRKRAFLLEPQGEHTKLPTDFAGLNTIKYQHEPRAKLAALLGAACTQIRKAINELGPRE